MRAPNRTFWKAGRPSDRTKGPLLGFFGFPFLFLLFLFAGHAFFIRAFAAADVRLVGGRQALGELGFGACVLGIAGEVFPFVGIDGFVVELFVAVLIMDVAPALAADSVIAKEVGGQRGLLPRGTWIGEQGFDAAPFQLTSGGSEPAEIDQRGVDAHEIDGSFAEGVGFGEAWGDPNQGCAGGFFPEREFAPVFLFAQVPAVVAPKDDDGVVLVGAFVEGGHQAADVHIGVGTGGEVSLDGLLPATGGKYGSVVARRLGHLDAAGWHVVEIMLDVRWQLDLVEGEHVVVFPGHVPGHVRLVQAHGEKERFVMSFAQLFDAVIGDFPVVDVLVLAVDGGEFDAADAIALPWSRLGRTALVDHVIVPFAASRVGLVVNLAGTANVVASVAKGRGEHLFGRQHRAPVIVVLINACGAGAQAAHQRRAGRIADGRGAIAAGKPHTPRGQGIDIRSGRLGIASEVMHPVVEVVHGDKQHVWLVGRKGGTGQQQNEKGREAGVHTSG